MPTNIGPVDPAKLLEIDFVPTDTHVYAYRLWWREPGGDWVELGTGGTATGSVNHFEHAVAVSHQMFYVVNVGTAQGQPKPAPHTARFTFKQRGVLLGSGSADVAGTTDALGVATNQDWVNFT